MTEKEIEVQETSQPNRKDIEKPLLLLNPVDKNSAIALDCFNITTETEKNTNVHQVTLKMENINQPQLRTNILKERPVRTPLDVVMNEDSDGLIAETTSSKKRFNTETLNGETASQLNTQLVPSDTSLENIKKDLSAVAPKQLNCALNVDTDKPLIKESQLDGTASAIDKCDQLITESQLDSDRNTSPSICRICHCGNSEEQLLTPCNCRGTSQFVHGSCLVGWLTKKRNKTCELCLYEVKMKRHGLKPFSKWTFPRHSCDFIGFLFGFYAIILLIFVIMILRIASNGCKTPVCVVLYFISGISLFYFSYCCGFVDQIKRCWTTYLDLNRKVVIENRYESDISSSLVDVKVTSDNLEELSSTKP